MVKKSSNPILDERTIAYAVEQVGMTKSTMPHRKGKKDYYSVDDLHISALFQQEVRHV